MRGPGGARRVYFFDLDDTLHDASHAIFGELNRRMTAYIGRRLALDEAAADALRRRYWQRYGATLLGLVRHHAVDARHFLRETHDFDVAALLRAERGLAARLRRLAGRKLLLTNAPAAYAAAVTRALRLRGQFARHYPIEALRLHGSYRPKPSVTMLRVLRARERCARGAAVLIDDSRANLRAARAAGFATVLMAPAHRPAPAGRPAYVDLRLRTARALPRALARLRGRGGLS